ncbi:Uncharacterized lipoprotein YddW, UPF0748 family [Halpernia humi]|uniref:Uncharacterized lipoprotein YddW, UPF0748 family n=1 Tax=Halpernia humi TaxID=493375 RepID=A0A1H5T5U1_9FLAO|nr:family 10 glycosylhydrolase [Halpernia humi]SEF58232.1 Uncharacterized lipoprotein YddW, UPF0748 family [Halpernia humi]
MLKLLFKTLLGGLFIFLLNSCATKKTAVQSRKKIEKKEIKPAVEKEVEPKVVKLNLPEVPREFRAAWVATVANINWPSRNDLTTVQQKAEAIQLLDLLKDNNFNAVIFQARPSADALYESKLEPWSYFLTGQTGKAPNPYYDPLQFWISEAHKRGLELHVWLNPFRAYHTTGGKINSESLVKKMSDDVVKLRNGTYWMDPASENVQNHVSEIVKDLVARYDLDGVHFDDYFYPYKEYNGGRDFPDTKSWKNYLKTGGTLSRADWRRANVNKFVKRIYEEIKLQKNDVKFGISPFGIWKSGFPADVVGSSQYDELFADAKLWLNQGWMDYFSPQLYWPISSPGQNFNSLLNWWKSENTKNRHLWPGLNTVEPKVSDGPTEIVNEINSVRKILPASKGEIHYSIAGLSKSSAMTSALKNGPYKEKALVPETPWLKTGTLKKPEISLVKNQNNIIVNWTSQDLQNVREWLLYTKYGETWAVEILTPDILSKNLEQNKLGKNLSAVAIKSVGKLGNESPYVAEIVN